MRVFIIVYNKLAHSAHKMRNHEYKRNKQQKIVL